MITAYFAYGSNLNRSDMAARCTGARPIAAARLEGWRLTFRGVADIEPAEGCTVQGALWSLDRDDLRSLDRYEGAPSNYRRRTVEVETHGGRREAMTYVMTTTAYLGLPSPSYLGRIEVGFVDWGLPLHALKCALAETEAELAALSLEEYQRDGPKRMKAVIGDDDQGAVVPPQ